MSMNQKPVLDWKDRIIEVKRMRIADIAGHKSNPKKHPKNQADAMTGLLNEVGKADVLKAFYSEAHGGKLTLWDGHLRQGLDPDQEWWVAITDLDDSEAILMLAAFDPIAALAQADAPKLAALLAEVQTSDDAIKKMLADMAASAGLNKKTPGADTMAQPEIADELRSKWGTDPGQVWAMGPHRIICGDCTDPAVISRLMQGDKANLLFTSPPYWIGKDYETQRSEKEIDGFIEACVKAWADAVSVDYGRIVINTGSAAIHRVEKRRSVEVLPLIDKWQHQLKQKGWLARHWRIWAKSGDFPASISPKTDVVDQHWEHLVTFDSEFSFLGTWWAPDGEQRGQEKIATAWAQQGVWSDIQGQRSSAGTHIAAFPLELPLRNVMLYTQPGEIVLDPFLGSGTTLISCDNMNRHCRGAEIDPGYLAVTLERYLEHTDQTAERVE